MCPSVPRGLLCPGLTLHLQSWERRDARWSACRRSVYSLHAQIVCADGYRLTSRNFVGSSASFPVYASAYVTCRNLPYPLLRRAKEEAMPRHPRHPRKGAFISLLFTLVLTLWLGGTLSAFGSARRPRGDDHRTAASLLGTGTPPVGTPHGPPPPTPAAGPP